MRRSLRTLALGALIGAAMTVAGFQLHDVVRQSDDHAITHPVPAAADTGKHTAPWHATDFMAPAGTAAPAWPGAIPTPEQILYAQPQLMRHALSQLRPQRPGQVDLYLITFAGDGAEDVFRNEAEYAAKLFAQRFDARGHTLVLENNPASMTTTPLATWSNLEAALAALHKIMDPRQDILMLYLTSHGSDDHGLLVDLDPMPLDAIYADDLASILAEQTFRWKVVVVNACYSGGFIPPLAGAGTLILTAARSDRSSFGCGSESKITYFGDAWLARGLNHSDSLVDAFKQAKTTIAKWEKLGKMTPSEPQISIGSGITTQLQAWHKGFKPGPALPFHPAAKVQRHKQGH